MKKITVAILLGTLFVIMVSGCVDTASTTSGELHVIYVRNLNVLVTRIGVEGSYYLGTGSTQTETYYVFHEQDSQGYSAIKTAPAECSAYVEDIKQGASPIVEKIYCANSWGQTQLCMFADGTPEVVGSCNNYYLFHIPEGTVASIYDLGLVPNR